MNRRRHTLIVLAAAAIILPGIGFLPQIAKPVAAHHEELLGSAGASASMSGSALTSDNLALSSTQGMQEDMNSTLKVNDPMAQEHQVGNHEHSSIFPSIALWTGFLTLLASPAAIIKIRMQPFGIFKYVSGVLSIGAGVMHSLLMPDHLHGIGLWHILHCIWCRTDLVWLGFHDKADEKTCDSGFAGKH